VRRYQTAAEVGPVQTLAGPGEPDVPDRAAHVFLNRCRQIPPVPRCAVRPEHHPPQALVQPIRGKQDEASHRDMLPPAPSKRRAWYPRRAVCDKAVSISHLMLAVTTARLP